MTIKTFTLLVLLFFSLVSTCTFASDISYTYSNSSLTQKSYIEGSWYEQGRAKTENLLNANLTYGTGTSNQVDQNGTPVAISISEYSGSIGLNTPSYWSGLIGLSNEYDLQDSILVQSSFFQIAKKIKYEENKDPETGFIPYLKYKLRIGSTEWIHQPAGANQNSLKFDQYNLKLTFYYVFSTLYDFNIGYKKYFYPNDPTAYANKINSLNYSNMTSLYSNLISQVADNIMNLNFNYHFNSSFSLETGGSLTKDAADTGSGTDISIGLDYNINEKWNANINIGQTRFSTIPASTTYTTLNLNYSL